MQDTVVKAITRLVMEKLKEIEDYKIPVGVSNRHIHLCKEDLEKLFGEGYELTKIKELKQPHQYAAAETVIIRGPKGEIENIRVLGPLRDKTQLEVSLTDSFRLGVKPPIRESNMIDDTPGIVLVGPKGIAEISKGTIIALRHIHMTPEIALNLGVEDKDIVEVETCGERRGILGNVLVRVSPEFNLEMHVDLDEANACALKNGDYVILRKKRA